VTGPCEVDESVRHLVELGYVDPLVVAAQRRRDAESLESSLKQSRGRLEAGKLAAAIKLLKQLAVQAPEALGPHRLLARAYFRAGELDAALGELRWLEVHGYEHAESALLRATIALRRRELAGAIDQAQYARCLQNPLPAADVLLGEAYFRCGELQSARAAFQSALDSDGANAAALAGVAAVCLREGEFESSVDWALQALDEDMRQPAVHYRLSLALLGMERRVEAAAALEMAVQLDSRFAAPHRRLASLYDNDDAPRAAEHRRRGREIVALRRADRARRVL
jgi:tetratricopeptide (TPR) repeat protein